MELSGTIMMATFKPTQKDPSKQTMVFSVEPDGGGKHEDFYANTTEFQAQVTANLLKHVIVDYTPAGKWKNINSIKASEAPKQEVKVIPPVIPQVIHNQFVTERQKQDSIESQNAATNVFNAWIAGKMDDNNPLVLDTISLLRGRIPVLPYNAPQIAKKAPEGMFATDSTPRVNKAQLANLRKYVKAKNDGELLAQACYRCNAELKSLEEIPEDTAIEWLNEVMAKK
jgi:hypothetical protein